MGELTPDQRAAHSADRDAESAFHTEILARGLGRFYWARFPQKFDKGWTVVQIHDGGWAVHLPAETIARARALLDGGESLSQFAAAALIAECERREEE